MLFANSSKYPVGLDISDLSLKLVQLQKRGAKIKIQALGHLDVPEGLIVDGEIKDTEKVVGLVKELVQKPQYGKVSSDMVVACLPETKTFIKLIKVSKTANNLNDTIETEIQKHVPMLIDEIYYDWQIIENKGSDQLILIGASPKKIVNQYTDLLDKAQLSVEALEIESTAISRSVLEEESPKIKPNGNHYAIIDMGAKRTSLVVYAKNTILFTASVPISGEKITSEISTSLEISKEQAEKAKIICGLNDEKTEKIISKILDNTIKDLNDRIKEVLEFSNNHFSQFGPVNKILLGGGGANIKGIADVIKKAVSLEVVKSNPLINIDETPEDFLRLLKKNQNKDNSGNYPNADQNEVLTFTTALGLALREVFVDKL